MSKEEKKDKIILDTSALMNNHSLIYSLRDRYDIVIPLIVVYELDGLKESGVESKAWKARRAIKSIIENKSILSFDGDCSVEKSVNFSNTGNVNDDIILSCAYRQKGYIHSDDYNLCLKAASIGVPVYENEGYTKSSEENYKGYTTVQMNDEEMTEFYSNLSFNRFELLRNEYLLIKDSTGQVVDKYRWDGEKHCPLRYKKITNNDFLGIIKPLNLQQELAFDMLQDKESTIKIITGKFGTGKDFMMISHAIDAIKKGLFDKLLWVRNNYEVKNTKEIGFLPGDKQAKLLNLALPMADHLGGIDGLNFYISSGKIELEHLGFMRGRDIKNAIIYCTEAENMTKEHAQLLIGRIGKGSALWMNGDFKQVDDKLFESNSGLGRCIERLSGNPLFGYVELQKTERSATAALADELD